MTVPGTECSDNVELWGKEIGFYEAGYRAFQTGCKVTGYQFTSDEWHDFKAGFQAAARHHYDMKLRSAEPSEHEKIGLLAGGQGRDGIDMSNAAHAILITSIAGAGCFVGGVVVTAVLIWMGGIQ
ncbi:MAG: hypothetical protein CMF17_11800 [Idiomarinaceae bacterium]|nr:hypothetical protein [Idiomarinaceae bacterium]